MGQISSILQERLLGTLSSKMETNLKAHIKSIATEGIIFELIKLIITNPLPFVRLEIENGKESPTRYTSHCKQHSFKQDHHG